MRKSLLFGMILTVCVIIVTFVFSQVYPWGMISYWKFDEGEGTIAYDSVDGNHGTINGATWTTGIKDNALMFNGSNYVDAGNSDEFNFDNGTGNFTIEAFIYRTSSVTGGFVANQPAGYAARLEVDYPEELDRLTTFFRLIWIIPINKTHYSI